MTPQHENIDNSFLTTVDKHKQKENNK